MRPRRHATFETLSISALDLFASSLGAFMLLALMLFPFWLRQPELRTQTAEAQARAVRAEQAKEAAATALSEATETQQSGEEKLARARNRLSAAEAAAAAALRRAASADARRQAEAGAAAAATTAKPAPSQRRPGIRIDDLDLVVVMDTTGSMRDELADAQANLLGIIRVLQRLSPALRVGFVAYRDAGDAYVTRAFPLGPVGSGSDAGVSGFVRGLAAGGGGDDPEAVDEALAIAVGQSWRRDAQGRILVVGDARAHPESVARALDLARQFRASGSAAAPRSVATIFTGNTPADRTFFQQLAQAGGGDFSNYQGAMIENVLLSVLDNAGRST